MSDDGERVVVGVTGGPGDDAVLRRAARLAGSLYCVHVVARGSASAATDLRALAHDAGASFHLVVGRDVGQTLLEFARGVRATQVVLGTGPRARRAVRSVLRDAGPIDVHLVLTTAGGTRRPRRQGPLSGPRRAWGWMLAVGAPVLATLAAVADRDLLGLPPAVALFVLAVVVVAVVGGLGPAIAAALLSGLLLTFFLTLPLYSLRIADPGNVVTLLLMVVVAVIVALVVDRAAARAEEADRARAEAGLLGEFAATVLRDEPLPLLLEKLQEAFGATSVALLERAGDTWQASAGTGPVPTPADATDVVTIEPGVRLALCGRPLSAGERRVLQAVAGQVHLALRGRRLAVEAREARRRAEATELRSALLSAVGHDLRTPLTSIKAAASSLRDPDVALCASDTAELLATVEESADRLQALVDNLLDSARLATGAVVPQLRPTAYDEVVARALATVDGSSRVAVDLDETLPVVHADAGLLERVVANLVDNALRHGEGAAVAIRAAASGDEAALQVVDHGPGLPPDPANALFTPFQRRGDRTTGPGIGLGLAVARGFTEAMAGRLEASPTAGGGVTMTVTLRVDPLDEAPPLGATAAARP